MKRLAFIVGLLCTVGFLIQGWQKRGIATLDPLEGAALTGAVAEAQPPISIATGKEAPARRPAVSNPESYFHASAGSWRVVRNRSGFVESLSGASFSAPQAGTPAEVADSFLQENALKLFGVDPAAFRRTESRPGESSSQIIYEQEVGGLPLMGSRVNMIFGSKGELIYLTATTYPGPSPSLTAKFNQVEAAHALRRALIEHVVRAGGNATDPRYQLGRVTEAVRLSYRLAGDSISLIYKAELPVAAPLYGSVEGIVDAQTNTVVSLRTLVKN